jgi:hypothetical protein
VPSAAYETWTTDRARRIDDLLAAHTALGGNGPGRRWRTESVNWSLILRLAAEFQGFARDLHNQAVECCVHPIARSNPSLANVVQLDMTRYRNLDKGNANPGGLGADFARLGIVLWPALERTSYRASTWNKHLDALNTARNAAAHSDNSGFLRLQKLGYQSINLSVVRRWRRSLDSLATAMDEVVGDYLALLLGGPRPW